MNKLLERGTVLSLAASLVLLVNSFRDRADRAIDFEVEGVEEKVATVHKETRGRAISAAPVFLVSVEEEEEEGVVMESDALPELSLEETVMGYLSDKEIEEYQEMQRLCRVFGSGESLSWSMRLISGQPHKVDQFFGHWEVVKNALESADTSEDFTNMEAVFLGTCGGQESVLKMVGDFAAELNEVDNYFEMKELARKLLLPWYEELGQEMRDLMIEKMNEVLGQQQPKVLAWSEGGFEFVDYKTVDYAKADQEAFLDELLEEAKEECKGSMWMHEAARYLKDLPAEELDVPEGSELWNYIVALKIPELVEKIDELAKEAGEYQAVAVDVHCDTTMTELLNAFKELSCYVNDLGDLEDFKMNPLLNLDALHKRTKMYCLAMK